MEHLLQVRDLEVQFSTYAGVVQAVRGINFDVSSGEVVALVGESGCGKSVTAQSIMRLIPSPPGKISGGSIMFNNEDIFKKTERQMRKIRGNTIGMIFQDPMTFLNPVLTIATQVTENLVLHKGMSESQAKKRAVNLFELVGIPEPEARLKQYPHQFSGGMRQRAMIAMALACEPLLLIADEPTTSLDVTIQSQILDLLQNLQERLGMTIVLISHNLGVVARLAKSIVVMYAGKVVESGPASEMFYNSGNTRTQALLKALPRQEQEIRGELATIPGTPPDLFKPPAGCAFAPRCKYAMKICVNCDAEPIKVGDNHYVSGWLHH